MAYYGVPAEKPRKLTARKVAAAVRLAQAAYLDCFLSEANCRRWMERNPDVNLEEKREFSLQDVKYDVKLNEKQMDQMKALVEKYESVFAKNDDEPPLMKTAPVNFELKPGAEDKEAHCATISEHYYGTTACVDYGKATYGPQRRSMPTESTCA